MGFFNTFMSTFSDKPIFNLKQLVGAIVVAITIGGGIARFEIKSSTIENKLNTIISSLDTYKIETNKRFEDIELGLLASNTDLKAVTTSLTAILKPEDITIKKRR